MKTVLNVKTDVEVKERAQELARHLGIPLSTIVNAHLKAFIESGEFKVSREPQLRPEVVKELRQQIKDAEQGINMSPKFNSAKDALVWLKTQ